MKRQTGKSRSSGFAPRHSLGQNFILDDSLMATVAEASLAGPEDSVLEIGPGMGTLTKQLADRAGNVLAIEVDETLRPYLTVALENRKNAEVIFGDVLRFDLGKLCREHFGQGPLRVAANIPYYITTEILLKVMRELPDARSLAFMVQREVADKLLAGPGEDGYGPLTILAQMHYELERALEVPADCFTPRPRVDSTFVVFRRRPLYELRDEAFFDKMLHRIFLMRRKTLLNNLISQYSLDRAAAAEVLAAVGVPEQVRAEALDLAQLARLSEVLYECAGKKNIAGPDSGSVSDAGRERAPANDTCEEE